MGVAYKGLPFDNTKKISQILQKLELNCALKIHKSIIITTRLSGGVIGTFFKFDSWIDYARFSADLDNINSIKLGHWKPSWNGITRRRMAHYEIHI